MKPLDYERVQGKAEANTNRLDRWVLASAVVTSPLAHWPAGLFFLWSASNGGSSNLLLLIVLLTPIFSAMAFFVFALFQGKKRRRRLSDVLEIAGVFMFISLAADLGVVLLILTR